MIRIAICEIAKPDALRMSSAIERYSSNKGLLNIATAAVYSYGELAELVEKLRPDFFDIVIYRIECESDADRKKTASLLKSIAEKCPEAIPVVSSSNRANAICAYDVDARFMPLPYGKEEFCNTVGSAIDEAALSHKRPFSVKSLKSIVNMNLNDITFVETHKKGAAIHLPESRIVVTRGTLQALFDRLNSIDPRFIRAGGSFIINLDNVRTAGESSVIFSDGEAIILPIRARKPMKDAFAAYRLRASVGG